MASHSSMDTPSRVMPRWWPVTAAPPATTPSNRLASGPAPEMRNSAPGALGSAADPGVAAHQPQHDAVHRKALVLGHDGVADLVDEDAGQERQSGDDAGRRVAQSGVAGRLGGEAGVSEADGQEGGDQDEGPVEADGDPGDPSEPHAFLHRNPSSGRRGPVPRKPTSKRRAGGRPAHLRGRGQSP